MRAPTTVAPGHSTRKPVWLDETSNVTLFSRPNNP